jgi:hypothetical protein
VPSTKKKDKSALPDVKLEIDKDGYPVLPSLDALMQESLYYRKVFIGRYMTKIYGAAAGYCFGFGLLCEF